MACEYCDLKSNRKLIDEVDLFGKKFDVRILKGHILLRGIMNMFRATVKINYCPMCGRKLGE